MSFAFVRIRSTLRYRDGREERSMRSTVFVCVVGAALVLVLASCSSSKVDPNAPISDGQPCEAGGTHKCVNDMCTCTTQSCHCAIVCSSPARCTAPEYCQPSGVSGAQICSAETCTGPNVSTVSSGIVSQTACVNGHNVRCAEIPAEVTSCGCGCPDAQFCESDSCKPLAALGQPCSRNYMCDSGHCRAAGDAGVGKCEVPINTPCTTANCSDCRKAKTGEMVCIQDCTGANVLCPPAFPKCLGKPANYYCSKPCDLQTGCPPGFLCGGLADNTNACVFSP